MSEPKKTPLQDRNGGQLSSHVSQAPSSVGEREFPYDALSLPFSSAWGARGFDEAILMRYLADIRDLVEEWLSSINLQSGLNQCSGKDHARDRSEVYHRTAR
jgi:hypothetical protein